MITSSVENYLSEEYSSVYFHVKKDRNLKEIILKSNSFEFLICYFLFFNQTGPGSNHVLVRTAWETDDLKAKLPMGLSTSV